MLLLILSCYMYKYNIHNNTKHEVLPGAVETCKVHRVVQ